MDLTGKLLIAMPGMGDTRFEHGVVLICAHSESGAMGLIINKPAPGVEFNSLMDQLGISHPNPDILVPVHFGGPVETGRGFVLHSADWHGQGGAIQVGPQMAMTSTRDVLEDLGRGNGPDNALLALGYAGWGPGQLEAEILSNGWLTGKADPELVFTIPNARKWSMALHALGVDPLTLSPTAGHA
ncbi:YqgE/AlgH family protein [Phaeovulum sp.]|uniref:YqgE/AlgH family protein n=1 Tax=Phaeovulum sp. TaxID=2934796 RepID=UPI0039E52E45